MHKQEVNEGTGLKDIFRQIYKACKIQQVRTCVKRINKERLQNKLMKIKLEKGEGPEEDGLLQGTEVLGGAM